jgi:hypothetical protein
MRYYSADRPPLTAGHVDSAKQDALSLHVDPAGRQSHLNVRRHSAFTLPLKEQQEPVQKDPPHFKFGSEDQVPLHKASSTLSSHEVDVQQDPRARDVMPPRACLCTKQRAAAHLMWL